jgi:diaminopimelate decarboxylase
MMQSFKERLLPILPQVVACFGTPFHLYDEAGIRQAGQDLLEAFAGAPGFGEYFAVKALPNPHVLAIMRQMGFGLDCSSIPELILSRSVGARGEEIMFTSNNTTVEEFEAALADGGCILNLDALELLDKVPRMPELICFRYNPGMRRAGPAGPHGAIIGNPAESKFGLAHEQILEAYARARRRGARRFGLHTMLVSNELDAEVIVRSVNMLLDLAAWIEEELGIHFAFINMGGGLGIPYRPEEQPLDLRALGAAIAGLLDEFRAAQGYAPRLLMESGRLMTGPHGVLVTTAINRKETARRYVGVDAGMPALMRPGMYGAYHHIDVVRGYGTVATDGAPEVVDVVGSLCENNDKFAVQRALPRIEEGDWLVIQDTGAHGQAMGFNYNGRLRPQELLLHGDGTVALIRRAETVEDYLATLSFEEEVL